MSGWDDFRKVYTPLHNKYSLSMSSHEGRDGAWMKIKKDGRVIIQRSCDDMDSVLRGMISELKYWANERPK